MNSGGRHALHAWLLAMAVVVLIGGAVFIYRVLPLAGVPVALVSGLAVAAVITRRECRGRQRASPMSSTCRVPTSARLPRTTRPRCCE